MKFELFGSEILQEKITGFRSFLNKGNNRRNLVLLTIAVLLIGAFQAGKGLSGGKKYIMGSGGSIEALSRKSGKEAASFPMRVTVRKGRVKITEEIILTIKGRKAEKKTDSGEKPEDKVQRALNNAISEVESSKNKEVELPQSLSDGTTLRWEDNSGGNPLSVILLIPVFTYLLYWNEKNKEKKRIKRDEDDVARSLPSFNDQLLMLLNCGMIVNDSLVCITDGYRGREKKGYFQKTMIEMRKQAADTGKTMVSVFCERANRLGIRELSRLAGIITDHQLRGNDITGKLESESEMLWTKRKQTAEEQGKLAETKLTFPLAILLVSLTIIVAAPAVIQVKGG